MDVEQTYRLVCNGPSSVFGYAVFSHRNVSLPGIYNWQEDGTWLNDITKHVIKPEEVASDEESN